MRFQLHAAALFSAACSTALAAQPARPSVQRQAPLPRQPQLPIRTGLLGFSVDDLVGRFGRPTFQVREGPGLKLQWSVPGCVLDTYLYPPPTGIGLARVTYAEARRPDGNPTDQAGCIAAVDAAG